MKQLLCPELTEFENFNLKTELVEQKRLSAFTYTCLNSHFCQMGECPRVGRGSSETEIPEKW